MADPYDLTTFNGPVSKDAQLARGERRHTRKVASKQRWQRIIDAKHGPCRVCGAAGAVTYHHLVARSLGGSDTEANVVPLCGHGTAGCHGLVERRDRVACAALRRSLTDEEYAYANDKLGEVGFESRYPVVYRDATRGET